jgi:hypothetical protein
MLTLVVQSQSQTQTQTQTQKHNNTKHKQTQNPHKTANFDTGHGDCEPTVNKINPGMEISKLQ